MTTTASHRAAPTETRRPLATGPAAMAAVMRANATDATYRTMYHLLRWVFQVYPARAALTFPQGLWWCLATWWPWVRDVDGREVARIARTTTKRTRRGSSAMSAQEERHDQHVRRRWTGSAVVAAGVGYVGLEASRVLGWAGWVFLAYVIIIAIGYQGRDRTQRWIDEANTGRKVPTIDVQLMAKVLSNIGISDLTRALRDPETKEPSGALLDIRAARTADGSGQVLEVQLPIGVTAQMVMLQHERFAGGLRRAPDQVFLEAGEQHAGLLVVTVLDKPARLTPPPEWIFPREVDIFEPIPVGHSPAGDLLWMRIMFQTLLIGAVPDAGKTWSLRALCSTLQWDPRVKLAISEMKGTGDLVAFRDRCVFYRSGNDADDLAATAGFLRWLKAELRRRQRVLKQLASDAPERVPANKLTRELMEDLHLDLPAMVVVLDEFHELSEGEHRHSFEEMVDVARQARAVGIILVLATQRPDADAITPRIRDMLTYRFGLRCLSRDQSNMTLGDGMARAGYDCTQLSPAQQGTGWLRADKGEPQLVRWGKVTPAQAAVEVADSMAHWGIAAEGHGANLPDPAGGAPDDSDRAVIDYLAEVLDPGEEIIATSELADRLQGRWPAKFHGWTATRVSRAVGPSTVYGLRTADRRVDGRLLKTLTRHEILAAAGHQLEGSTP